MKKTLKAVFLGGVFTLSASLILLSAAAAARDGQEVYNKSCVFCHANGAANAPKTGLASAWQPRLEKGMPALVASARDGYKAMPPKALCMDCSDAEYKAAIEWMIKPGNK